MVKLLPQDGGDNNCSSSLNTEWLDTPQAATYLGVSAKTLLNMVSYGQVPVYKLGRRNRYLREELKQLLLSNKKGA